MSHDLASISKNYLDRYKQHFSASTTTNQWSALNATMGCRTEQYGKMALSCNGCSWQTHQYRSCGHRSCNQCQHHSTKEWLDRQEKKLLPVNYYMVTFTLPRELRVLAKANQKTIYSLLFTCANETLKTFGLNEPRFAAELTMTGVLHTHTRRLDYHPHVHMIVPGGGIKKKNKEWQKIARKYLFNSFNLATVFRGMLLKAIKEAGLSLPQTPKKWVVHCKRVGRGLPALKYLSRYLYRGVISNKNIIADDGNYVTFRYKENSGETKTRRLRGEEFMALVLQHTLPKGFRRARDFGFLHGNAKRRLKIVQWALKVIIEIPKIIERAKFICKQCGTPMSIVGFLPSRLSSG